MKDHLCYALLLVLASGILILYVAVVTIEWNNLPKLLPWDHRKGTPPSVVIHHLPAPEWLKSSASTKLTIPSLREAYPEAFEYKDIWTLPTNSATSFFKINNYRSRFSLCDTITVNIEARDASNKIQSSGDDYFFANIYDFNSRASSPPDDHIVDHQNGTYSVKFTLRWVGTVKVTIFLVHPSEAVRSLRRVRDYFPARQIFIGKFAFNNQTAKAFCHVTAHMYVKYFENTTSIVEFCDFTDPNTGSPWFCIKPEGFPCSSYQQHSQTEKGAIPISHLMHPRERRLFEKPVRLRSVGSNVFRVTSKGPEKSTCLQRKLSQCIMGNNNKPKKPTAGYYYKELWESFQCQISHFAIHDIKVCLHNRVVYFFGDSTIRQWFTYIAETLDNTKFGNRYVYNANYRMGDDIWRYKEHNIKMHYHHHGFPNMVKWVNTTDVHYMANMIDEIPAKSGTIVFLSIAAHFTITNLDFYRTRLSSVKDSIKRLQIRSPKVHVFVKTANTRDMDRIDESNWFLDQINRVLREEMAHMDVTLLDVWAMTTSHWTMFHVHPCDVVLQNEIDMALSYICPLQP